MQKSLQGRLWKIGMLANFLAIACFLWGSNYYIENIRQSLWHQAVADALEITRQSTHALNVYIERGYFLLAGRASHFSENASTDISAIGRKLDLYEYGDPSFSVIDLSQGKIYFNSRISDDLPSGEKAAYDALPERGVLPPYIDEYTGQRMFGYYEKFLFADGAQGVVRKGYPLAEVADDFSLSLFNDTGFSYVVDAGGNIMMRPNRPNSNRTFQNVFDVVEVAGNSPAEIAAFRNGMSSGKRGAMRLLLNNEDCVFTFVPVNGTAGWYVVSIVPSSSIMAQADNLLQSTQMFIFVAGTAVVVFILFGTMSWHYRRRIIAQKSEVKYREQLFSLLANRTDQVFLMLSGEELFPEYVSPNVARVLGVPRQTVMDDITALPIVTYKDGTTIGQADLHAIPLGEMRTGEGKFTHPATGENRWVDVQIYHSFIDDNERFIIALSDRTSDKQKEYALTEALDIAKTANQSKSAFLSNMSHDIRTPMNAIIGLATLLRRDAEKPDKIREHTKKITAASQHLLGLINDVLDMSKIESGKTTLAIGDIDLAETVDELATIIRPQAKAKQQEFEIYVHDLKNEKVLGDKLKIKQVLINILSNAVKYTPDGGHITMNVRQLSGSSKGYARFHFQVKDDGFGMDKEFLQRIFQPFTRAEDTMTRSVQGTGLGMAITKNLVDLMGGAITVDSEPGKGSCFTVNLELRVKKAENDAAFWQEHAISRLLVADDEKAIGDGVLAALKDTVLTADAATDGKTAVKLATEAMRQGQPYDIILLDWSLPDIAGREIVQQISTACQDKPPLFIILSSDCENIEDEGRAAGVTGFLPKPFFLGNLKQLIKNLKENTAIFTKETGESVMRGKHFLIAEDNDLNAEILVELLDMKEASCEVANNGKIVLEKFQHSAEDEYAAILMDVQMPMMSGYEATRSIRALDRPDAKTIPIIAMTANAFADDVIDALKSGMDAHVAKPIDLDRLEEALQKVWQRRKGKD